MKTKKLLIPIFGLLLQNLCSASMNYDSDTIKTSMGNLIVYFVGHGTLYFEYNHTIIHIDPVSRYADYTTLPKADIILVTHQHGDHFDTAAIKTISKTGTELVFTKTCSESSEITGRILNNGESVLLKTINIEAVPAYNIVHKRDNGEPFHLKGEGNGYVITFGDTKVYVAGDTENIPEMADLKDIDIAFLPMNLPYTMTPEMVADAVEMIKPRILYPYHFGNTNTGELLNLLKEKNYCEVRIRQMQ
jgi:L-ascorbate metabolism protein UlaG (beta-lactamase superfamily)